MSPGVSTGPDIALASEAPLGPAAARARVRRTLRVGLLALLVVAIACELFVGPVPIRLAEACAIVLDQLGLEIPIPFTQAQRAVFMSLRLPRVLAAGLVGAALGSGGAALQGLFRNPLADPQLIGVSSGASVGAALVIVIGAPWLIELGAAGSWGPAPIALAAFVGALASTMLVYRLSSFGGRPSMTHMLLAGVAMNAFAFALVGVLQFSATDMQLRDLTHWMLGEVGRANWAELPWLVLAVVPALIGLHRLAADLDVSLLGDGAARDLGVDVDRMRRRVIVWVALAVGVSVASTGPIGFVGLAVPHMLRLMVGSGHKQLLVDAALLGAALLIAADALARVVVAPAELPVGILTTLLGAPLFLGLLLRDLRGRS
jgi:iron complex transport system permease protein